jgi:hypothetical protein
MPVPGDKSDFIRERYKARDDLLERGIKHVMSQSRHIAKLGQHLLFELIIQ